jgi:hypothetical protein
MQNLRPFSLISPVFALGPLPPKASNRPGSTLTALMTLMALLKNSTTDNRLSQQIFNSKTLGEPPALRDSALKRRLQASDYRLQASFGSSLFRVGNSQPGGDVGLAFIA